MALLYRDALAPPVPPAYLVRRTGEDAFRDGGRAWVGANLVEWGPARYRTRFQALWSPAALFVRFDCLDDHPWHTMTDRDAPLWEEEVVEIFIAPAWGDDAYVEIEISPANVVCDLRVSGGTTGHTTDRGWNFEGLGTRVIPWRTGRAATTDWTALAVLPWAGFRTAPSAAALALPPGPNNPWRFNVFRIKRPGGPAAPEQDALYAAWSVPDGLSFHARSAFRDLVFA